MNEKNQKLYEKLKTVKAVDIMSKFAITTKEETTISDLAHLMMRFKISGVPVLSHGGKICGIATATDLFNLMKKITNAIDRGEDVGSYYDMKIDDIMTKDVVTITKETTLLEVMRIMVTKNIHTLPVMVTSGDEIIGIIGRRDILNACYAEPKVKSEKG